jgi:hypothetical protein
MALVAIFAAVSGAFVSIFFVRFHPSIWVIPAHVLCVQGLLLGALLAAAALRSVWNAGKWTTLFPVIVLAIALCALYVVNAIAWVFWIDTVSFKLIAFYALQIGRFQPDALGLPAYLLLVPLCAGTIALAMAIYGAAPSLYTAVSYAAGPGDLAILRHVRRTFSSIVLLTAYCALYFVLYRVARKQVRLRGEPLLSLIGPLRPTRSQLPNSFYSDAPSHGDKDVVYRASRDPGRKNVILIVADSLRADHLGIFGYPRDTAPLLSRRLDGEPSLTAKWATAACSISECGVLAIMTSHPFQRLHAGLFSLPDAFHTAGYETYFIMSGDFSRSYGGLSTVAARHARLFIDGLANEKYSASDDRVILDALDRIPEYAHSPAFFYFHLMSTHLIGVRYKPPTYQPAQLNRANAMFLGAGDAKTGPAGVLARLFRESKPYLPYPTPLSVTGEILTNNYDNGIRQADGVMNDVLAALKQKGYLNHSVIVITADHGEGLGEHGAWGHGNDLYAESIDIPLIILDTDLAASRSIPYATQLDIAPTIADTVGIPIPEQWEGKSLLTTSPDIAITQTSGARPIQGIIWRTGNVKFKYLFDSLYGTESLFELRSDPAERINLMATADPSVLRFLRGARVTRFSAALSSDER